MIEVLNNCVKQIKISENVNQLEYEIILELFASMEVLIEIAPNDKSIDNIINISIHSLFWFVFQNRSKYFDSISAPFGGAII